MTVLALTVFAVLIAVLAVFHYFAWRRSAAEEMYRRNRDEEFASLRRKSCPRCHGSNIRVLPHLTVESWLGVTIRGGVSEGGTPQFSARSTLTCTDCQIQIEGPPTCGRCFGQLVVSHTDATGWDSDFGDYYNGANVHGVSCPNCGYEITREEGISANSTSTYDLSENG